jgi:hypothetical protein
MRADVQMSEDTTTLYLRWEVVPEGGEVERLERLGGPLRLCIEATSYVDEGGTFHERIEVDVPIWPHKGRRNFGQAKFRDYESRRNFLQNLQDGVTDDVASFVWDGDLEAVPLEGHVIHRKEFGTV